MKEPPPHTHTIHNGLNKWLKEFKYKALHNITQKKFKVLLFLGLRKPGIISSVLESRTVKAARTRKPLQHLVPTIRVRCFFPLF